MITTILSFIVVLGILIFIHEFGHYITAKLSDIRVEEFALGFGPKLLSRQWGETVYSIRAIPLGGFCNMTGEFIPDEDDDEEDIETYNEAKANGRCFHQKSMWKRFAVIFMGPFMNFMLALLIFFLIFNFAGLPVDTSNQAIIGELDPSKPASEAGLLPGDKIVEIEGQQIQNWEDMTNVIHNSELEPLEIVIQRDGENKTFNITPIRNEEMGVNIIGIYPKVIRENIGFFASIQRAAVQGWRVFYLTINGFIQMISNRSMEGLGGPVMIASIIGQAARNGIINVMNWTAIISINLGIINLLPLPALDGGRILFIAIELIRGKPVDPKKEGFVHLIGFVLLMILMLFIIYNDIARNFF
ncbi:MAG TPA: RIP metalloprotease RseP [Halanaerobiales bacterium]|nr:RIP metalloprotease RseP [Halanaerobiales bacterium]